MASLAALEAELAGSSFPDAVAAKEAQKAGSAPPLGSRGSPLPAPRFAALENELRQEASLGALQASPAPTATPARAEPGPPRRVSFEPPADGGPRTPAPTRQPPAPAGSAVPSAGQLALQAEAAASTIDLNPNPTTSPSIQRPASAAGSDMSVSLNASARRNQRRQARAAEETARSAAAVAPPGAPPSAAGAPWPGGQGAVAGPGGWQQPQPMPQPLPAYPQQQQQQQQQQQHPGGQQAMYVDAQGHPVAAFDPQQHPEQPPPPPPLYSPLYTKPIPPNVLAVTVERTESLRYDNLLTAPVVRLHLLDPATGAYVSTLDDPTLLLDAARQAQNLEYPGRPSQRTADNAVNPSAQILRELPPVQTQPFELLSRPEIRNLAAWEETLLVDEAVERLLALDPLFMFEVLQPPISYQRYRKHDRQYDTDDGSHLVAWGFLRPAGPAPGPDGSRQPLLGRLKLQLYEYKHDLTTAARSPRQAAGDGLHPGPALNAASRAYINWQALMAVGGASVVPKYPSALTVVLQAVPRPEPEVVVTEPDKRIRPYLPAGYGSGFETSKVPLSAYLHGEGGPGMMAEAEDVTKSPHYRPITEPCKVPNAPMRKLPGAAAGVTCMAFSHNGLYLAAACGDPWDRFKLCVYKTLTGALVRSIHGAHNGFVYEIAWARDDSAFITASADGTAKVWELNPAAAAAAMAAAEAAAEEAAQASAAPGAAPADATSPAPSSGADAAAAAAAAAPRMSLLSTMKPSAAAAQAAANAAVAAAASAAASPQAPSTPAAGAPRGARSTSPLGRTLPGAYGTPTHASAAGGSVLSLGSGSKASSATHGSGAAGLPHPTLLRHACYVYSAQFHPVQKQGSALVATGAYDGTVRLWRRYTGELLAAVKTQRGAINSLCFDKLGTRLYAADSAGVLQEFSCDVNKGVDAAVAAPGGTNLSISTVAAPGSNMNATMLSTTRRPGGGGSSAAPSVNLNASMLPRAALNASMRPGAGLNASMRPGLNRSTTMRPGGSAGGAPDAAGLNASISPGGIPAAGGAAGAGAGADPKAAPPGSPPPAAPGTPQQGAVGGGGGGSTLNSTMASTATGEAGGGPAVANILRVLRQCDEFDGEPLAHVFLHHSGRRLGVLTKRSRLLVLETRSLSKAEQFLGVRCREAPLKASFSPDGRYLVCGSEDGRVVIWDADGGPPTLMPHLELGGDTVYQVAWNPLFHIAAVCSYASWAPLLISAYDPRVADVALRVGHKNPLELAARDKRTAESLRPKWTVPDRLTPEFLHHMLADLRRDAKARGIIAPDPPGDPNGDHLVVPYNRLAHIRAQQQAEEQQQQKQKQQHLQSGRRAAAGTGGTASSGAGSLRPASAASSAGADLPTPSANAPALDATLGLPGSRFAVPPGGGSGAVDAGSGAGGEEGGGGKMAAQSAVAKELLHRSMARGAKLSKPTGAAAMAGAAAGAGAAGAGAAGAAAAGAAAAGAAAAGAAAAALALPPPAFKEAAQEYQWQHPQQQPQPQRQQVEGVSQAAGAQAAGQGQGGLALNLPPPAFAAKQAPHTPAQAPRTQAPAYQAPQPQPQAYQPPQPQAGQPYPQQLPQYYQQPQPQPYLQQQQQQQYAQSYGSPQQQGQQQAQYGSQQQYGAPQQLLPYAQQVQLKQAYGAAQQAYGGQAYGGPAYGSPQAGLAPRTPLVAGALAPGVWGR